MQLSSDQQCMQERFDLICGKTSLAHEDQLSNIPSYSDVFVRRWYCLCALWQCAQRLHFGCSDSFCKPESFCIFQVVGTNSPENTTDCPFNSAVPFWRNGTNQMHTYDCVPSAASSKCIKIKLFRA